MIDRLRGGGGYRQRPRIGVADVLGGEDHHPAHDEARILAALEHHREVVQRGIWIGAARGLDPCGDVVVVEVPPFVVQQRAALQGVLGPLQRDARLAALGCCGRGELQRVQGGARIAFAARREEIDRLLAHRRPGELPRRVTQHRRHLVRAERAQRVHAQAREQRSVDLEGRVLGRRPDQGYQSLLDRGQQRILLGLVEAVDLVQEEHRRHPGRAAVGGALDHAAHLRPPGRDGAQLLEHRRRALREDPRERRLARAGRAVQHHRVRPALLDRHAQRRALAEQVRLPHEIRKRARPHARRKRRSQAAAGGRVRSAIVGACACARAGVKQRVGHGF